MAKHHSTSESGHSSQVIVSTRTHAHTLTHYVVCTLQSLCIALLWAVDTYLSLHQMLHGEQRMEQSLAFSHYYLQLAVPCHPLTQKLVTMDLDAI